MSITSLERTAKALRVWQANPEMKLKNLTVKEFQAQYDRMGELEPDIEALEEKLTPLRNERDALADSMSKNTTRVRGGIRSYFGEDSDEYELAGGTRTSERRKSGPKKSKGTDTPPSAEAK
ncbi:MAG: hypothetical protein QM715_18550 [Nibricoccus sp.]